MYHKYSTFHIFMPFFSAGFFLGVMLFIRNILRMNGFEIGKTAEDVMMWSGIAVGAAVGIAVMLWLRKIHRKVRENNDAKKDMVYMAVEMASVFAAIKGITAILRYLESLY